MFLQAVSFVKFSLLNCFSENETPLNLLLLQMVQACVTCCHFGQAGKFCDLVDRNFGYIYMTREQPPALLKAKLALTS